MADQAVLDGILEDTVLEEDLEEALDDLQPLAEWASGAVLWSTDWTAETIVSQLNRGNIDLDPSFQRRSAWTDAKQSLFIESLILGLPIPQLILAEAKGKKGAFIVIDGKQRLLSIRRFASEKEDKNFPQLKLRGLGELQHLNKKTVGDLRKDPSLGNDLAAFENSSIRTIVIRNWQSDDYLYEVFLRINTGSVQLSPQELRQALHPGDFSNFVNDASAASKELQRALKIKGPDFRMRDAEILLRYLAYKNYMADYNGNLKRFLDTTTENLSSNWNSKRDEITNQVDSMNEALRFTRESFSENHYLRKWNGKQFESRKNRAVFDIMLHYFSIADVRDALVGKSSQIKDKFKDLCETNPAFYSALESTTKSIEANRTRFNVWGDAVAQLSSVDISPAKFPG